MTQEELDKLRNPYCKECKELHEQLVTVCDQCLKASCWQGEFFCDDYQTAGTFEVQVKVLRELAREHCSYWHGHIQEVYQVYDRIG